MQEEGDDSVDSRAVGEPRGVANLLHMETDIVMDEQTLRYSAWVCVCATTGLLSSSFPPSILKLTFTELSLVTGEAILLLS